VQHLHEWLRTQAGHVQKSYYNPGSGVKKCHFNRARWLTCKPWLQCTATHHVKAQLPYGKNGNAPLPSHPWAASLLGQS